MKNKETNVLKITFLVVAGLLLIFLLLIKLVVGEI